MKSAKRAFPNVFSVRISVFRRCGANLLNAHWSKSVLKYAAFASTVFFAVPLFAQGQSQNKSRAPLPEDWSNQHVVFSPPASPHAAAATQKDPRYQHQQLRRSAASSINQGSKSKPGPAPTGDWSVTLGSVSGTSLAPLMFPAKFSFDVNAGPSCTNDFSVFAVNKPGLGATASQSGTFSGDASNGQTVTINDTANGGTSVTLTASLVVNATGSITIGGNSNSDVATWPSGSHTVTVGSTTYTFVTFLTAAYQVLIGTDSLLNNRQSDTARNLTAAINANPADCTSGVNPCFGPGTVANSSVTAHANGNTSTLTAITGGSGGDFTLSSPNSPTDITLSGGNNGVSGLNTGTNFAVIPGDPTTTAANLAAAINRNNATLGVTATSSGGTVTITANTAGAAGNNITLSMTLSQFSWSGTGSSSTTLLGGVNPQSSILAFNNLYSGASSTASVTGTFSANTVTGSQSVTITNPAVPATLTLTPSDPVAASQTGTFSALPTSTTNTITITNGSNVLTAKTNATAETVAGTFASAPSSATSISIANSANSNTLALTTNATPGSVIGTFGGNIGNTGSVTITNTSSGSNTLTLTNNGTAAKATGTFAGAPSTATSIAVTSGSNTLTLTNNGTAKNATGTFAGAPLSTTSIAVTSGSNTLTLTNNGAGANATGTFAGPPSTTTSIAVNSGSNTLNLTTNATKGSAVGTFSTAPPAAGSITITNSSNPSGSNALALTSSGSFSNATGTFTGPPSSTTSITITSGSNTLTLTNNATAMVATITLDTGSGQTTDNGTLTLNSGSNTLILSPVSSGSNGCSSSTTGTFVESSNAGTAGGNLASAINNCNSSFPVVGFTASGTTTVTITASTPGSSSTVVNQLNHSSLSGGTSGSDGTNTCAANSATGTFATSSSTSTLAANLTAALNACPAAAGVRATQGTGGNANQVTVSATTVGTTSTWQFSVGGTNISGNFSWSGVTAGTDGTSGCSSSTSGTFITAGTTSGLAANLRDAINACNTAFPSTVGVTATASTNTVTVTDTTPGAFLSVAETITGFAWGSVTGNSNGSPTCSTSTSGTFATSNSTTTLATNLAAAINSCPVAAGVTAGASGNTVTVTDRTPGSFTTFTVGATNNTSIFTWGGVTPGTNGTQTCTSATTGTFVTDSSTANLATNLRDAINACNTSFSAVGATASASGSTVTVTDTTPGTFTTFSVAATNNSGIFTWGSVTGGSNGTQTCPSSTSGTFITASTPSSLATNLAAAINACNTSFSAVGATASTSTSTVTVTDTTPGSFTTFSVGATNNTGVFTWSAVTPGTDGTQTCPSSTSGTFINASATSDLATNLAAAINACNTSFAAVGVTASAGGSTVTVTATKPGNFLSVGESLTGFSWGSVTGNSAGTNSCPSSTTGTFATSSNTTTLASNLAAAIALCPAAVGVTASASGSTVTVKSTTLGSAGSTISVGATNNTSIFTWAAPTLGTDGSNGCPTLATATFATSSSTTTVASNLASTINLCHTSFAAIGVTASSNNNVVTVTAVTLGTGGNSIGTTTNLTGFAWGAATLSGGSSGNNTGANFTYWSGSSRVSTTQLATNLAAAINRIGNGNTVGVSASSSSNVVTITATSAGSAGNNITLGGTLGNFSWSNPSLVGGSDTGLCGSSAATVMWGYQTTTAPTGAILTSPVLSLDGTKLAYVESTSSGSILHVLRWKAGEGNSGTPPALPVTPTNVITSGTCPNDGSSCVFNLTYTTSGNTFSSPFYNYATDELYVGDDGGVLWKISGVFNGTPAVAWSITVNPSHKLTGPVFDSGSQNIFVGDDSGKISFVQDSGSVGCGSPPCLGSNAITALTNITDPPIVDSSTGKILVFTGNGGANANVVQADTTLGNKVTVNVGQASSTQIHAGTLDNNYYAVGPAAGFLYVCGKDAASSRPVLRRIGFASDGTLNGTTDGNSLNLTTTTTARECSPLTEIFNPGQGGGSDWLFAGVPGDCAFNGSATGCIMSINITSTFPATAASTGAELGGTSGIVVDNVSTSTGQGASLYFSTLSNATCGVGGSTAGCAVKRTQSGLQ